MYVNVGGDTSRARAQLCVVFVASNEEQPALVVVDKRHGQGTTAYSTPLVGWGLGLCCAGRGGWLGRCRVVGENARARTCKGCESGAQQINSITNKLTDDV